MKAINQFLCEASQKYFIYLDMDGVICDMDAQFEKLGKGPIDGIVKRGGAGMFFAMVAKEGIKFWSEMPWTKDGKQLWHFVKQYPCSILSAPTKTRSSFIGKDMWVNEHLGKNVKRIFDRHKYKYASPDSILIDDMEKNIKPWIEAGGIGILHTDTETTIKKLKEIMI